LVTHSVIKCWDVFILVWKSAAFWWFGANLMFSLDMLSVIVLIIANAWNDRLYDLMMLAWSWSVGFFFNTQWPFTGWVWQKVLSLRWRRLFSMS
jgi:hypothetical protein